MKPNIVWILIADGARARIVQYDGPNKPLSKAMDQEFAAPHAASRDFVTDKPGRGQGGGTDAHHAVDAKIDWHTFEKHLFAKEMANLLNEAKAHKAYDELVLVAPPKTLGDLRKALDDKAGAVVRAELDKDLTHVATHDLSSHLDKVLAL